MYLSPTSTQYLVGALISARNDIVLRTEDKTNNTHRKIGAFLILGSLKSQNFDAIKPHKYTVSCGDPVTFLGKFLRGRVRVAHFVFEITLSQAITLTLLLVCAFSPRVHSIPRGPHNWQFPQGHKKSRQKSGI